MRPFDTIAIHESTTDTLSRELLSAVDRVVAWLRRGSCHFDGFERIEELLESLPLASDAFNTATNRLKNARRYLRSDERGAARYEIQLLANSLRNHFRSEAEGSQVRRRRRVR